MNVPAATTVSQKCGQCGLLIPPGKVHYWLPEGVEYGPGPLCAECYRRASPPASLRQRAQMALGVLTGLVRL